MVKPKDVTQSYWDSLSEEAKKNFENSMLGDLKDGYYVNKYGRAQLHKFDEAIENYKNYNEIKLEIEGYPGFDSQGMIRPTVLSGWDFLVRPYRDEKSSPDTVEELNYDFEQMVTAFMG